MPDVSIKEVAKLAGVSIATVSRCVNNPEKVTGKTRLKVQTAIQQTGYAPNTLAQSFRSGRTNLIMVVLPTIGDPFFSRVMRGIRQAAKTRGYSVVIEETQFNTMTADEIGAMMVSRQTDGIILLASLSPFGTEVLSAQNNRRIPIVVGCETIAPELSKFPSVHIDNLSAARDATNLLLSHGHTSIAMLVGPDSSLLTRDRELGFRAAMSEASLPVDDDWVLDGQLTIAGARIATRALVATDKRPTAIFCANDEMAIGCIHEVKVAGLRVPEDISVMGFDDTRYAAVADPPLTTISQPAEQIGERVVYRLLDEISGTTPATGQPEILSHRLVVRQSVSTPVK